LLILRIAAVLLTESSSAEFLAAKPSPFNRAKNWYNQWKKLPAADVERLIHGICVDLQKIDASIRYSRILMGTKGRFSVA
jgi:hypothetical protein